MKVLQRVWLATIFLAIPLIVGAMFFDKVHAQQWQCFDPNGCQGPVNIPAVVYPVQMYGTEPVVGNCTLSGTSPLHCIGGSADPAHFDVPPDEWAIYEWESQSTCTVSADGGGSGSCYAVFISPKLTAIEQRGCKEDPSRFLMGSEDGKWHCLALVPR